MPSPSGLRRSGFACGAPSREGTRSGQCATGTLSAAPTSGVPRRSKLCIACSDLFYKSERAHAAAPPFQTATAMLGCGLGPPLHGGFVFPWEISILTVLFTFKRLPVSGKSFLFPVPAVYADQASPAARLLGKGLGAGNVPPARCLPLRLRAYHSSQATYRLR